jgi:hypothetical protein
MVEQIASFFAIHPALHYFTLFTAITAQIPRIRYAKPFYWPINRFDVFWLSLG